jgi:hypothetical protein
LVVLSERGAARSFSDLELPSAGSAGFGLSLVIRIGPSGGSYVHMTRDGWSVSSAARMALSFDMDGEAVVQIRFQGTDDPAMIEGSLAANQAASLIERLSCGRQLVIRYLAGTDGSWTVPIQGTYQILQASFQLSGARAGESQEKRAVLSHGP